jgi:tRNA1Val (adenine37-N6)-methyltransferase
MTTAQPPYIEQNTKGYRYSVEPFLLADFIEPNQGDRILDVGTGCGVIPLLLARRYADLNILGIEIQSSLFKKAFYNVSQNGWGERITLLEGDFLKLAGNLKAGDWDYLISNPPYRKKNSGRVNPCSEKALARHELTLTLSSLIETGIPLLRPEGRIVLAYPSSRLNEVTKELEQHQFQPRRLVHILGHKKTEPRFFLVEAARGSKGSPLQEETLTIYQPDGSYTQRMQDLYASFDYSGRPHRLRKK